MIGDPHVPVIAIVGSGFSGTLTAIQLLRRAPAPLRVVLIERTGRFGPGVAYGTRDPHHLLNVPAQGISAFADAPDHFLDWARRRDPSCRGTDFLPRAWYGEYLTELLATAREAVPKGVLFESIEGEVVFARVNEAGRAVIRFRSGSELAADQVVLALGNLTPDQTSDPFRALEGERRYLSRLWSSSAWQNWSPESSVLIVGSGLSMVDAVTTLRRLGHRGPIRALSRRGLLPTPHQLGPRRAVPELRMHATTARRLLRAVRAEVAIAAREGGDWRTVIDGIRPQSQAVWRALPFSEKRRFLRHLRPYWEVHRHRMPAPLVDEIRAMVETRRLELIAGRIQEIVPSGRDIEVSYTPRGGSALARLSVDYVINCMGHECDYRRIGEPLIRSLLDQGLAQPDPLGMGLDVDDAGQAWPAGAAEPGPFFAIGPLRKGSLWETTAVPELRAQAEALATRLVVQVGSG